MYKSKKYSEASIQSILYSSKLFKKLNYKMSNVYMFENWESDFFMVGNDSSTWEIEIKIDKQDLDRELAGSKSSKHDVLKEVFASGNPNEYFVPNYFYYCLPEGMLSNYSEIPPYAGVIEITDGNIPVFKTEVTKVHGVTNESDLNRKLLKKFYNKSLRDERKFIEFKVRYDAADTDEEKESEFKKYVKYKRI